MPRVDVITMGCSKNLVDSERLLRRIESKGYEVHHDSDNVCGDIVVVNTCGFIGDAKEESVNMILELANLKEEGTIGKLIVMGCLSERYRKELAEEIPEVDEWYGKFDWGGIIDSLPVQTPVAGSPGIMTDLNAWDRKLTTQPWSAFLKISEGCNRFCAYCAIPIITGRHKSRSMDELVAETSKLAASGVKEFNIIAQDLSAYGTDLYGRHALPELMERLSDIEGVEWLRLHYAYPVDFPMDSLRVMRERSNICTYLDMALQHISDPVLSNMRRHITSAQTYDLIAKIRDEVPDIRLRTTLMTGFPGEGKKEFDELMQFVEHVRFDRMGAFAYSPEEGTYGFMTFNDDIPQQVKEERLTALMELQEGISAELHSRLKGEKLKVLIDSIEDGEAIGRTQWDSPEVDPVVIVTLPQGKEKPRPGTFVDATITATDAFELQAIIE